MRRKLATVDALIARIAASQYGIIGLGQLRSAGLGASAIQHRTAAGRLHRIHRGVYAVGHRGLSPEGRWIAAVMACEEGAVLSHRSAAELWRMLPISAGPVDVTVPGIAGRARRPGIRVHRSRSLSRAATTLRRGIPVTTPARTIADLRRTTNRGTTRTAIRQAEFLELPVDAADPTADRTRSELEGAFLRLCRRYHLPEPEVNVRVGRFVVDALWPKQRLVVELDGYRTHRGRQAFEDDRARDVELRLRGYEVLRFTYRQVDDRPSGIAEAVRALLSAKGDRPRANLRSPRGPERWQERW